VTYDIRGKFSKKVDIENQGYNITDTQLLLLQSTKAFLFEILLINSSGISILNLSFLKSRTNL